MFVTKNIIHSCLRCRTLVFNRETSLFCWYFSDTKTYLMQVIKRIQDKLLHYSPFGKISHRSRCECGSWFDSRDSNFQDLTIGALFWQGSSNISNTYFFTFCMFYTLNYLKKKTIHQILELKFITSCPQEAHRNPNIYLSNITFINEVTKSTL